MLKPTILETKLQFGTLFERDATNRIIVHHTGGADIDASAAQIHSWHLDAGYCGIGYHFVIRKNGNIERGRPIWAIGSHAYGSNSDSIGIQLSGDFTFNAPTDNQIESAAILIAYLCDEFNIPTDRKHILGHREVDPDGLKGTSCPGNILQDFLDVIAGKANWYRFGPPDVIDAPPKSSEKPKAGMLSEHFAEIEFNCECCGNGADKINPRLIELLEQLRHNCGGYPIYVISGFRCKSQNPKLDDVLNLQHQFGNAADISCPKQLSFGQFKWYVQQLGFDDVRFYENKNFVHVAVGG